MKKIYAFLFTLLLASGAAAQNPTAYFMEGSTLRSQFNPAFAPLRGYVNIPGLGGLDINVSGNLSIDKILYPRNGKLVTLLDSSVSTADALSGLKADNLLGLDTRVNLIGFGAFTRNHKNFWSFDLNARVTTDATLPYSLFDFLKRGNSGDISDIGITADSYLEAGFNYSFPLLDDKLYIGVRAKFLMGVARARMYFTQFNVSHNEERWLINAAGGLDITAAGLDVKTELNDHGEEVYKMDDISLKPTSPAGYGFAVDFGATYDILPNLQASLAVNDLGFIGWSKNKNVTGYSAKELSFTGVTVTEDGTESPDFDIDVLEFHKGAAKSVSRMLRASINAGLEYEVWRHKIGIGLLYTARVWEYKTLHNITGSVNFHPIRWFTVTGSYSVIDNRGGAVGLALNLNPSWINFYLATDIVTAKVEIDPAGVQVQRDERHAGHRSTDRQTQPPYRGLCVRQGSAVNERTGNPAFSGRVFLIRTPENSAEPGIKTLGVRKKDSLRQQTHPPFPYFRRTHTTIGQWHWFIGNFIYLCNVEITKAFLRGRSHFPAPDDFAIKYCDGPSNLCEVASLLLNSSKSRAVAIFLSP